MICGHGHKQKFKYPYPWDSKIIQMPYPRAKAIDQIPALCPAFSHRLDTDRCTIQTNRMSQTQHLPFVAFVAHGIHQFESLVLVQLLAKLLIGILFLRPVGQDCP